MLSKIKPASGKILISEPFMMDPNFKRSVILIVEHEEEGTVGFVLNQETEVFLSDIMEELNEISMRLFIGGPVQPDTLHFIHTMKDLEGGKEILPGVFWGGNFEQLKIMINNGQVDINDFRFFIGYSGWGIGQLDEEIDQNSWIVADTNKENLFAEYYEDFWKETVRSLGSKFAHIANFPENPFLN
jgi:putative transcriptional regulator